MKNSKKLKTYLLEAINTFDADRADTEFKKGYLTALIALISEMCMTEKERIQHRILKAAEEALLLD